MTLIPNEPIQCEICYQPPTENAPLRPHTSNGSNNLALLDSLYPFVQGSERTGAYHHVHSDCYDRMFIPLKGPFSWVFLDLQLQLLLDTSQILWPVSDQVRRRHQRQLVRKCFTHHLLNMRTTASLASRIIALPRELQDMIASYLLEIPDCAREFMIRRHAIEMMKSIQICNTSALGRCVTDHALGKLHVPRRRVFFQDIVIFCQVDVVAPTKILISFDLTGCCNVAVEGPDRQKDNALWYRSLTVRPRERLCLQYKGYGISNIVGEEELIEDLLWNIPTPPRVQQRHSYGMPLPYESLQQRIHFPLRMKHFEIPERRKMIQVACNESIVCLHIASQGLKSFREFIADVESLTMAKREATTWLAALIDDQEDICEVAVTGYSTSPSESDEIGSLTIFTTWGRRLHFGPVVRNTRRTTYLVNDPAKIVTSFVVSERMHFGYPPCIGVTCKLSAPTEQEYQVDENPRLWERRPSPPFPFDLYHSTVNVTCYSSCQFCTEPKSKKCIGIFFHGDFGAKLLGQWRSDWDISENIPLSSPIMLRNVEVSVTDHLCHVLVQESPSHLIGEEVLVHGCLEWWTWSTGSQVQAISIDDENT